MSIQQQELLCTALEILYCGPSRPAHVNSGYIDSRSVPAQFNSRAFLIRGDGSCGYRAFSLIISGNQGQFKKIKEKILRFVRVNKDLYTYFQNQTMPNQTMRMVDPRESHEAFLAKHGRPAEWADETIFLFASYLFNTKIQLFNRVASCWTITPDVDATVRGTAIFEDDRLGGLPLTNECMYIDFVNNNHFEVAHNGML